MIIRKITVMLVMLNAAAAFLIAAGSGSVYGIEMETGISSTVESVESAAESVGSGPVGLIDALGGATVAAVSGIDSLITMAFAAPTLFSNLGVPGFIVAFVFAPLYVVVALDMIAVLRGDSGI